MDTTHENTIRELFFKHAQKLSKVEHAATQRAKNEGNAYRNAGRVWVGKSEVVSQRNRNDAFVSTRSREEEELVLRSVKSCWSHSADVRAQFAQKARDKMRDKKIHTSRSSKNCGNQFQSGKEGWLPSFIFGEKKEEKGKAHAPFQPDDDDGEGDQKEIPDVMSKLGLATVGDLPTLLNATLASLDARSEKLDKKVDEKIDAVDEKIRIAIDNLSKMADVKGKRVHDSAFSWLEGLSNMFGDTFKDLHVFTSNVAQLVTANIIVVYAFVRLHKEWTVLWSSIACLAVSFIAYKSGLFSSCHEIVMNALQGLKPKGNVHQAGVADDVTKFVVTAMSFIAVGCAPPGKRMKEALSIFSHWSAATRSGTELVTWVLDKVKKLLRRLWFWSKGKAYEEAKTGINDLDSWVKRVVAFLTEHQSDERITSTKYHRVMALLAEGRELRSRRWHGEDSHHVHNAIMSYYGQLDRVGMLYHAAVGGGAGPRQVPLAAHFIGAPGGGKSSMTMAFVLEVLTHVYRDDKEMLKLLKKEPLLFTYTRPAYDQYWEGVRRDVEAVIYNDFGQSKDGEFREFHESLNGIDSWPFHVPMAQLESKADTFIAPKLWVATANGPINPDALTWTEALNRRFHLKYRVCPKAQYSQGEHVAANDRKFDESKIRSLKGLGPNDGIPWYPDAIEFHPVNFKGESDGRPISWDDLIKTACETYNKLERDYNAFISSNMTRHKMKVDAALRKFKGAEKSENEHQSSPELVLHLGGEPESKKEEPELVLDEAEFEHIVEPINKLVDEDEEEEEVEVGEPFRSEPVKVPEWDGLDPDEFNQIMPEDPDKMIEAIFREKKKSEELTDLEVRLVAELCSRTGVPFFLAEELAVLIRPAFMKMKNEADRQEFLVRLRKVPLSQLRVRMQKERLQDLNTNFGKYILEMRKPVEMFSLKPWVAGFANTMAFVALGSVLLIGIRLIIKGIKMLYKYIFPSHEGEPQSDPRLPNPRRAKQRVRVARAARSGVHQGGDLNADGIAKKALRKGQWTMHTGVGTVSCTLTCLRGRIYNVPTHIVNQLRHSVKTGLLKKEGVLTLQRVLKPEEKQQVLIQDLLNAMPLTHHGSDDESVFLWTNTQVNPGPDLLKFFLTEEEHHRYVRNGSYATLYVVEPLGDGGVREIDTQIRPVSQVAVRTREHMGEGESYALRKAYQYSVPTQSGHCGALLVLNNTTSGAAKLLGVHCVGNPQQGLGYATVIYREDLEEAFKKFPQQIKEDPDVYKNVHQGDVWDDKFITLFNVERKDQPRLASVNSMVASKFLEHEECPWENKKLPSRLRPFTKSDGTYVHPFLLSVSRYVPRMIPLRNFRFVRDCMFSSYVQIMNAGRDLPKREMRVLTFEEAVAGVEGDLYLKGIPRTTSAGYPLCLRAGGQYPGKTLWFGKDGPYTLNSEECKDLKKMVNETIAMMERGERPLEIILDVLKDELLSIEKVENGATRFISATPLVSLIIGRMYYGAFSAYMMETRILNGHAVAVNPYSAEWEIIKMDHSELGGDHYDGDAKALDTSIQPYLMHCLQEEIIFRAYANQTEKDKMVRTVWWTGIFNSRHIFEDLVYEWDSSNPSGFFLTWLANGETMKCGFRIAFCEAFCKRSEDAPRLLEEYPKHMREIVQGDDNFWTPSEVAKKKITPFAVRDAFAQIGVTYTTATKNVAMLNEFKKLDEISFLKRGFRYEPLLDRHVSPLSLDTIREMVLYHPKWDVDDHVAKGNVRIAALELSQHDDKTFEEVGRPLFDHYFRVYKEMFPVQRRDALLREITNCTWDSLFDPMKLDTQGAIGMLGSGASKGDGPAKTELQELCVQKGKPFPSYTTTRTGGPDHAPLFESRVVVWFGNFASAKVCTKVGAEESAASDALAVWGILSHERHHVITVTFDSLPAEQLRTALRDLDAVRARIEAALRTIEKNPGPYHTPELYDRRVRHLFFGALRGENGLEAQKAMLLVLLLHVVATPRFPIQGTFSVTGLGSPREMTEAGNSQATNRVPVEIGPIATTISNNETENASVAQAPSKTTQGTDEMLVAKPGPIATVEKVLTAPLSLMEMNSTSIDPDLKQALGNWVKVSQGTIDSSKTPGTAVFSINPLTNFLADSYMTAKVTGYQGIRGTLVAKIAVNANAFQQGRLLMVWIPQSDHTGMLSTLRVGNLTLATQLPKVELDIATMSEATLEMPFIFPSAFHSFLSGLPTWGKLALIVYSTYAGAAGGSTSYAYTAYVSFKPETVQLFNPTYMTTPQGGDELVGEFQSSRHKIGETKKGKAPANMEVTQTNGKVSGTLSKVSNFATMVGKMNPDIAVFAEPLAWVTGLAAGVAKWFGHGTVLNTYAPVKFNTGGLLNPCSNNCEEAVIGSSLGGTAANSVDVMPGFAGSAQDEMLLDYLLQKSAFVSSASWTTSNVYGDALFISNTAIQSLVFGVTGPPDYFVAPPIGYISQFFGLYHGGLRFTFKFSKTPYHEGRLLVVFYPGKTSDPGIANSLAAHRTWIDISEGTEFMFTTPFTSHSAYIPTTAGAGFLAVYVVNPLIAPASVAQSVTLLIEVGAAPGFELACLQPTPYAPCIPSFSDVGPSRTEQKNRVVAQHENHFQSSDQMIMEDSPIAGAQNKEQGIELARLVVGERIMSVKQLMMMATPVIVGGGIVDGQYIRPFTIGCAYPNVAVWANGDLSLDYYSAFAPMFLYSRGGVKIGMSAISGTTAAATRPWDARIDFNVSDVSPVGVQSDVDHCYRWSYFQASSTVYVPGYNQNWARLNFMSNVHGGTGNPEPLDSFSSFAKVVYRTYGGTTTNYELIRGAADDYQAGFFLGVPPFASLPSNTMEKGDQGNRQEDVLELKYADDQIGSNSAPAGPILPPVPSMALSRAKNHGPMAVAFPK